MRITKPMMRVLERAFAKEIERAVVPGHVDAFPLQLGKSKAVQQCVDAGFLVPREQPKQSRLGTITFTGHELTQAGRFAYCSTCDGEQE